MPRRFANDDCAGIGRSRIDRSPIRRAGIRHARIDGRAANAQTDAGAMDGDMLDAATP